MAKRARAKKRPKSFWPSWRYGPNGESKIFAREEDVPEGWTEHRPKAGRSPVLKVENGAGTPPAPVLDPPPAPIPPAEQPDIAPPSALERMRAVQLVDGGEDEEDDLPPAQPAPEQEPKPARKLKRGRPKKGR